MYLNEYLLYKVVFDGYLFIPYFIIIHQQMHNYCIYTVILH